MNSPFDKRKYERLLKGLEASEVLLSELNEKSDRFRYDAEFVKKEYLNIEKKLASFAFKRLNEINATVIHPSEIKREYLDEGEWFFRTQNLRSLKIEKSNDVFISKEDAKRLANNEIKYGDVLITRTGANYGQTAIYNIHEKAIASSHVLILRNDFFNQYYLAVFFNTSYGKKMIDKGMYGGAQPEISPYYISNIPIPIFTKEFQLSIENKLTKSKKITEQSAALYREAENLLLEEIGLATAKDAKTLRSSRPSRLNINIKSFKDSFGATGRLDAEYYQKKYEEIIAKIKKQPHDLLMNLVNIKKSIEPGSDVYSDEGVPFVRVADYSQFGITKPDKYLSPRFCEENKDLIESLYPEKETILFSKDGSVGTALMLREDLQAITSGAILHLTVKDKTRILPEYLTLVLNSKAVQMQAERDAGGSIILHWRIEEIQNVVVPIIPVETQARIASLIQKSFALRKESEGLLEDAKAAVEREVEGG